MFWPKIKIILHFLNIRFNILHQNHKSGSLTKAVRQQLVGLKLNCLVMLYSSWCCSYGVSLFPPLVVCICATEVYFPCPVCCCVVFRVNLCLLTLSVELCVSASRGLGWLAASMETTSGSSTRTSNRILVSENKTPCSDCVYDPSLSAGVFFLSGCYFTGDGAYRSEDGYYQITGRMDDVINVSGHRLGTAEIEDALVRMYFLSE